MRHLLLALLITVLHCTANAQEILYVDKNATGANNGSSWADAITSVYYAAQEANRNTTVKEIHIAGGTYTEGFTIRVERSYAIRGSFDPATNQQSMTTHSTVLDAGLHQIDPLVIHFKNGLVLVENIHMIDGIGVTISNLNSNLTLLNCQIGSTGQFMENWLGQLTAINCVFTRNVESPFSFTICRNEKEATFINCTFLNNSTYSSGNHFFNKGLLRIYNSILYGLNNTVLDNNGGQIYLDRNIISSVNNPTVSINNTNGGTVTYANGPAIDAMQVEPLFQDATAADVRLKTGSPAIDKGSNDVYEAADGNTTNNSIGADIDLFNNPRVYNGAIDLGALEWRRAVQTLSIADKTATYGDPAIEPAPVGTTTLPVNYASTNDDIATLFTDTDNKQKIRIGRKGIATIKAVLTGNEQYDPSDTISFTVTVNPKPIAVSATPQSKVYGDADPALPYTSNPALVAGDSFTGNLSRDQGENAGVYAITQGNLNNSNYNISFVPGTFTIHKAPQHITWQQTLQFLCDGNKTITLTANSSSGLPVQYTSSQTAVATVTGNQLTVATPGPTTITATQPGNNNYLPAANVTQPLMVKLPAYLIVKHWNDVLLFDNSSATYSNWQWYKNGSPVNGATAQYYYESGNLNGEYYATVKNKTGETLTTCPINVTPGAATASITLFPNPATQGQAITVRINYTAAQLQGASIVMTNQAGIVIARQQNVAPQTTLPMSFIPGVYVVRLKLANGVTHAANLLIQP